MWLRLHGLRLQARSAVLMLWCDDWQAGVARATFQHDKLPALLVLRLPGTRCHTHSHRALRCAVLSCRPTSAQAQVSKQL